MAKASKKIAAKKVIPVAKKSEPKKVVTNVEAIIDEPVVEKIEQIEDPVIEETLVPVEEVVVAPDEKYFSEFTIKEIMIQKSITRDEAIAYLNQRK